MIFTKKDFEEVAAKTSFVVAIYIFEKVLPQEFLNGLTMEQWLAIYRRASKKCKIFSLAKTRIMTVACDDFDFWVGNVWYKGHEREIQNRRAIPPELVARARQRILELAGNFNELGIADSIIAKEEVGPLYDWTLFDRRVASAASLQECLLCYHEIGCELRDPSSDRPNRSCDDSGRAHLSDARKTLTERILLLPKSFEEWSDVLGRARWNNDQHLLHRAIEGMTKSSRDYSQTIRLAHDKDCPADLKARLLKEADDMLPRKKKKGKR